MSIWTLALALAMTEGESPIKADETVIFFPTCGHLDEAKQQWVLPIHGWIFEPETNGLVRNAALSLFRRTGQDPKPWAPTPEIVATGIYRFTRNPMYVGMALVLLALGLAFANAWIVALVPTTLAVVYWTAVRHEEAYLERKFGAAYARYKAATRRWL